jgi:hypothetical protein
MLQIWCANSESSNLALTFLDVESDQTFSRKVINSSKYLGLHLDRRLTCHKHMFTKRKEVGITLTKMHWLLGHKSKLSTSNKILIYKILELSGTASTSNMEILERFQSKTLSIIANEPWYVPNSVIRKYLQIPTVKEEIRLYSSQYSTRFSAHRNDLITNFA